MTQETLEFEDGLIIMKSKISADPTCRESWVAFGPHLIRKMHFLFFALKRNQGGRVGFVFLVLLLKAEVLHYWLLK